MAAFGQFHEVPARVRYRFMKSPHGLMQQFRSSFFLQNVRTGATYAARVINTARRPPFHTDMAAMRAFHIDAEVPLADTYVLRLNDTRWHQACFITPTRVRSDHNVRTCASAA